VSADRWDAYRPTMVPSGTGEKREYETVVLGADYERDVAAAEVEMMRLISRAIADGHRGNGSAEDDICCQVCQEIECDPDCAVAEARAREAAAEVRGWNAAVQAALIVLRSVRTDIRGQLGEYDSGYRQGSMDTDDYHQREIAALHKDAGREVGDRHYAYETVHWKQDICPTCTNGDMANPVFWPCKPSVAGREVGG